MALDERRLGTSTTRRTVVKSGATIAYAAPIVAASFHLGARAVGAQLLSGPGVCDGIEPFDCAGSGSYLQCCANANGSACIETTEGSLVCITNWTCGTFGNNCTSSALCPAGTACVLRNCCLDNECAPLCTDVIGTGVLGDGPTGLGR